MEQSNGVIVRRPEGNKFFFLQDNLKLGDVFAHLANVNRAQVAGHEECMYIVGQRLVYDLHIDRSRGYYAEKISIDPVVEIQLPEVETSTISSWRDDYGFAKRPCGCDIFVHKSSLPPQYQSKFSSLVGIRIGHEIGTKEGKVFATKVRILKD